MTKRTVIAASIIGTLLPLAAVDARDNMLLLCIDDLRPELACYGARYVESPHIDALAAQGRMFERHYVQAPTCGASRYALLTGTYGPYGNDAIFRRASRIGRAEDVPPSLPAWFRQHGYVTVSVGKVSHHPGGRGGPDWDDPAQLELPGAWDRHLMPVGQWRHPRGAMHGLAHGEIRVDSRQMDVFQSTPGPDDIYPDGLTTDEALRQLGRLAGNADEAPFFLAVGIIRPHLPLGAPAKYMAPYRGMELPPTPHPERPRGQTTWHASGEFMRYNLWGRNPNDDPEFALEVRRHYAACVTYADALVGRILARLDELDLSENTIVVLWGDHGWHLGEHAVWGKHTLFEESLRSPLVIASPGLARAGEATLAIVETVDVFPTVCDLAGLPKPAMLDGTTLTPILDDPAAPGHAAYSYVANAQTIRTESHRLISHADGHRELYDHRTPEAETHNLAASQPATVRELLTKLENRDAQRR